MQSGKTLAGWGEWCLYLCIVGIGLAPVFGHPGAGVGDGADAFGTWWFYDWLRRCIENGWNPSWTADFFYPLGKDLFAHTGNNFVDAVLSVPFQWGLHDQYQPFFVATLVLGNIACFRVFAKELLGEEGAFPATLLWACNPSLWFELTAGRPTQAMLWFLPAAALFLLRMQKNRGFWAPIGLGVSLAMAGWTYWFNLYFFLFLLAPVGLRIGRDRPDRVRLILEFSLAAGICGVLMLPALLPMMAAAHSGQVPGLNQDSGWFSIPKSLANNVSGDLHGLWLLERHGAALYSQPASLLGLGLLLWKRPLRGEGWLAGLLLALLFSLGPVIRLSDEQALPLPWYLLLYHKAPFFSRLWFPYRIAGAAFFSFCLLLGALARERRWLAPLLALGWLGGQMMGQNYPVRWHSSRPPPLLSQISTGAMIVLPMRVQHDGLMWQSSLKVPTFGGMGESAPLLWPAGYKEWMNDPFIRSLRDACFRPDRASPQSKERWLKLGYRWVLLRRDLLLSERAGVDALPPTVEAANQLGRQWADATTGALERLLGKPVGADGAVILWDLSGQEQNGPDVSTGDLEWMEQSMEWQMHLQGLQERPANASP